MDTATIHRTQVREKLHQLRALLQGSGPLLIAYSGGVDSTFLLAEAANVLGDWVLGVIADSPSLPRSTLAFALATAEEFSAKVEILATAELDDPRREAHAVGPRPAHRVLRARHVCRRDDLGYRLL